MTILTRLRQQHLLTWMQQQTLSVNLSEMGIYPAVDPLASTSRALSPEIVGEEHYNVARQVQQTLQRYRELQDIIAILVWTSFLMKTN